MLTVDDEHTRDIWGPAAVELLAALFLAGHLAGVDLTAAYGWLQSELDPTAVATLDQAGYPALARSLRASMEAPAETRGSVLFTARTAVRCLRDPQITAWTTARPGLDRFDPAAFVRSRQTLYLLFKDGGDSAAPLVAALTDRVLRCAVNAAEDRGGRLDPPRLVGEHDVPTDSWTRGDGRITRTSSTRRERIPPAAELRALPKGSALLLATGTRPALLALLPWYDGPRAAAVASAVQTATAGISRRGATAAVQ